MGGLLLMGFGPNFKIKTGIKKMYVLLICSYTSQFYFKIFIYF